MQKYATQPRKSRVTNKCAELINVEVFPVLTVSLRHAFAVDAVEASVSEHAVVDFLALVAGVRVRTRARATCVTVREK